MSEVRGASRALRKNIKRIRPLLSDAEVSTRSPRYDYNACLDALIREAFERGYKSAHKTAVKKSEAGKSLKKLKFEGELPAFNGRQKTSFVSSADKL